MIQPSIIPLLPVPYKGELFFGTLCRLYARMGSPAYTSFGKVVLGAGTANPGTTIPLHLDWLEKKLPAGYPLNADGIRKEHSLEPFSLGLVSWAKKRKYNIGTHLKSCPECRQKDMVELWEPIWRTIHQVEGMHYCLQHSCPLETSEKPSVFQKGSRSYRPEYFSPKDTTFVPIENIGNLEIHSKFLGMVQDILDGKNLPWKMELSSLWGEMERQGFTNGVHVDGWKVLEKGKEMFGPEMESLFGLTQTERGRRLITNVLTEEDPSPHRILPPLNQPQ